MLTEVKELLVSLTMGTVVTAALLLVAAVPAMLVLLVCMVSPYLPLALMVIGFTAFIHFSRRSSC